jgi:hypothetical protein
LHNKDPGRFGVQDEGFLVLLHVPLQREANPQLALTINQFGLASPHLQAATIKDQSAFGPELLKLVHCYSTG